MAWWDKLFKFNDAPSNAGMEFRVAARLYSQDGQREVEVCEFRNGKTYLVEREWAEGQFKDRHQGKMVGPFRSPKLAEQFIVGTAWFNGEPEPTKASRFQI